MVLGSRIHQNKSWRKLSLMNSNVPMSNVQCSNVPMENNSHPCKMKLGALTLSLNAGVDGCGRYRFLQNARNSYNHLFRSASPGLWLIRRRWQVITKRNGWDLSTFLNLGEIKIVKLLHRYLSRLFLKLLKAAVLPSISWWLLPYMLTWSQ